MLPPTTKPATTAPTSQPEDVAAIKKVLADYNAAVTKGDAAALQTFIAVSTDTQKQAMGLMGRLTVAGKSVWDAAVDKFTEAQLTKDHVDRTSFPAGFPELPTDVMDIQPNGDKASLVNRMQADAPPLSMKKVNGEWKIDGDALLPPLTDKQLKEQTSVLDAAIAAIQQTADDTKAGHFRGGDEVVTLMNFRVQKAVRAAQAKLIPLDDPAMGPGGMPGAPAGPTTAPSAAPAAPGM